MKKWLLAVSLVVGLCGAAFGAQVFTTTIQDTTIKEVQDVSLEYMMEKNFAIDRVEDYILTFTKSFGDGWLVSRNMIVKFNMLQRDGNVKLMVTQLEDIPLVAMKGQRSIEHLIPLIKDIRHSIDSTPLDQIINEATNQQPNPDVKTSGLAFKALQISAVEAGSMAEKAGLQVGDTILEVNGGTANEKTLKDIDVRLAAGRSVMLTYERAGKQDVVTLKRR
jgi:hypothetical protein